MKTALINFLKKQSKEMKSKVRSKAMRLAEENCIKYGKKVEDLSLQEWKGLVAMEEEKIVKKTLKYSGVGTILFGFMPWW